MSNPITNSQARNTLICWAIIAGFVMGAVASGVTVGALWLANHLK